jgi:hypothetical protein
VRTDRQAEMAKLRVASRNFANAPKNELSCIVFSVYVAFDGMSESSSEVDLAVLA